jgi:site-specific recombinase XerD
VLAHVPIIYVSKILGHANISTTSRYLNINRQGLHEAISKLEARQGVAQTLHNASEDAPANVPQPEATARDKPLVH